MRPLLKLGHYAACRIRESLLVAREPEWARDDGTGWPLPPRGLAFAVAGSSRYDVFVDGGRKAAEALRGALERAGTSLDRTGPVLDFGCGCGRVLRHLPRGLAVTGMDVDRAAVEWCRDHYAGMTFETVMPGGKLPAADESFGLIYALSVFTHLSLEGQRFVAAELTRVLRPGGWLVISTHGPSYDRRLKEGERDALERQGVVVRAPGYANSNYCNAFHRPWYVWERLFRVLEVRGYEPEGALGSPHQDLYVFERGLKAGRGQSGGRFQDGPGRGAFC
jgi:SAM-dependent methyltransferase